MRIIVVGAGVVGLLSAIECVRRGARVEVVEQAGIPSRSAASYDRQRVVRCLHRANPVFTRAAARLATDWTDIQRLIGAPIFYRTGVLTVTLGQDLDADLGAMAQAGVPAQVLVGRELAARHPQVRFEPGRPAILEASAGTVRADQALMAAARWLRGHPNARLHQHRAVVGIDAGSVELADGAVLAADGVIVAAGPWSGDVLPSSLAARLTLQRQTVLDYRPGPMPNGLSGPAILGLGARSDAWLIPPVAGAPARLSAASACRSVPDIDSDDQPDRWTAGLIDRFRGLLTGFDARSVTHVTHGHYLVDAQGAGPLLAELGAGSVWAYAACAGMSFKFAPPAARALADRAMGRPVRETGLEFLDRPRRFDLDHV